MRTLFTQCEIIILLEREVKIATVSNRNKSRILRCTSTIFSESKCGNIFSKGLLPDFASKIKQSLWKLDYLKQRKKWTHDVWCM